MIAVCRGLAEEPGRAAELDAAVAELGERNVVDGAMHWKYLLVTARRR